MTVCLKRLCVFCMAAGLLVIVSGCQKAPEQKLSSAKAACAAALEAEANKYAPADFKDAQSLLDDAAKHIMTQNKKKFFLRNYNEAENKLDDALLLAGKATETAKMEQQRIATEAAKEALEKEQAKKAVKKGKLKRKSR